MKVAVDAMGGDYAPREVVAGGLDAARGDPSLHVVLVGQTDAVEAEIRACGGAPSNLTVHHAADVVDMGDKPVESLKRKPDCSILRTVQLVATRQADSCVAAGSTGAAVAAAMMTLPRLPGVRRPGIAVPIPARNRAGVCLLVDAGANPECRPVHLLQYGVMGSNYYRLMYGEAEPRVALVSIGEEESKGNLLVKESTRLLKRAAVRFSGNAEGKDLFRGNCDVAVADGFVGNIILKTAEGMAEFFFGLLKEILPGDPRPVLGALARRTDYAEFGGAPLLGMDGVVFISHGRSDRRAIANAIRAAARSVSANVRGELTRGLTDEGGE